MALSQTDEQCLLDAEPRDIGGCGAGDSYPFQGPVLTGSDQHGGKGRFPYVSTVVKLEDRLRGVLETAAVLSHFEGTG